MKRRPVSLSPAGDLKVTFRLAAPYGERVVRMAEASNMSPGQFARIAVMLAVDAEFLGFRELLSGIRQDIIQLKTTIDDHLE